MFARFSFHILKYRRFSSGCGGGFQPHDNISLLSENDFPCEVLPTNDCFVILVQLDEKPRGC
jgi:hypothetical protein